MSKVETKKAGYRNLKKETCDNIIKVIQELPYNDIETDEEILPYIIQWLFDIYIDYESTCYIISQITNINRLQTTIDDIYQRHIIPLTHKTHLTEFLTKQEYTTLTQAIEPREKDGSIEGEIDDETSLIINYNLQKIYQIREAKTKKGKDKLTPVIEAVPEKLEVIDTLLLDQPRTFKIWWKSKLSERIFVTAGEGNGATIPEIEQYLINAGFSHSPRLVAGALSCMINTLIQKKIAVIKQDIDNPGFYYDIHKDQALVVKKDITKPSSKEVLECIKLLEELKRFFKDNTKTLSTVLKWSVMSEFSYAMKQAGKWLPWMYLKGSAGSGKTTLAKVGLFIYGEPTPTNNIGGRSADTVARLGAVISQSCDFILINEPAAMFNRKSTNEMVKVCVESTTGRSKFRGSYYGSIPAFSPVLFTANQYLPEDDALLRRMYVLSFSYSQRKSEHEKKMFEDKFHIDTPSISPLRKLGVLGRFALRHLLGNPSKLLDDWKEVADEILYLFYKEVNVEVPFWLTQWAESENLDDFDDNQREDLRSFFVAQFNQASKNVIITDDYGNKKTTLDIDGASTSEDFEDINWEIINNRKITWALPHISPHETRYVCLTQSLRKALSSEVEFCSDLKSIGELLGWEYKNNRFSNGKQSKVIKVKFNDFMEFLYPGIMFEEDE